MLLSVALLFRPNSTLTTDHPASCQAGSAGFEGNETWLLNGTKLTITNSDGTATGYDTTSTNTTMTMIWYVALTDAAGKSVTLTFTRTLRRV